MFLAEIEFIAPQIHFAICHISANFPDPIFKWYRRLIMVRLAQLREKVSVNDVTIQTKMTTEKRTPTFKKFCNYTELV